MVAVSARAPAKINLGLEILGKRRDGLHEIRSVLAMIDLCDNLRFRLGAPDSVPSINGVPPEQNLIDRAIRLFASHSENALPIAYSIKKRIPLACGLGGASSDAATTLTAINEIHGYPLTGIELKTMASELGSDVPFFLAGPAACVTGTGTEIDPIPAISGTVLLIVPDVAIDRKTTTLYGRIREGNFSRGLKVERTVERMREGLRPIPSDLHNAFMAPLYDFVPDLADLPNIILNAGCASFGLSGAGPTHYVLPDPGDTARVASQLQQALDRRPFRIIKTAFLTECKGTCFSAGQR